MGKKKAETGNGEHFLQFIPLRRVDIEVLAGIEKKQAPSCLMEEAQDKAESKGGWGAFLLVSPSRNAHTQSENCLVAGKPKRPRRSLKASSIRLA